MGTLTFQSKMLNANYIEPVSSLWTVNSEFVEATYLNVRMDAKHAPLGVGRRLSLEDVTQIREAFRLFDQDGNGAISSAELGAVMRSLGQNPSDQELTDIVNEMDRDGNLFFNIFYCRKSK